MNKLVFKGLEALPTDDDGGCWVLCDTKQVSAQVAHLTDDLPLVFEHRKISDDDLSATQKRYYKGREESTHILFCLIQKIMLRLLKYVVTIEQFLKSIRNPFL